MERESSNPRPILYMVIPCYNEEEVLPLTSKDFLKKLYELIQMDMISEESRILFVNDGSKDKTWEIIKQLAKSDEHFKGSKRQGGYNHFY